MSQREIFEVYIYLRRPGVIHGTLGNSEAEINLAATSDLTQ